MALAAEASACPPSPASAVCAFSLAASCRASVFCRALLVFHSGHPRPCVFLAGPHRTCLLVFFPEVLPQENSEFSSMIFLSVSRSFSVSSISFAWMVPRNGSCSSTLLQSHSTGVWALDPFRLQDSRQVCLYGFLLGIPAHVHQRFFNLKTFLL